MVQTDPYKVLEKKWAEFTGSRHAVSCNSGTSALHLALKAYDIGPGDEVIVPDFTMAAVAFAVSYVGATPVFADVDLGTYAILPSEIERLVTNRTKAVIAVHTYGRLAPMKKIMALANDYGFHVIEDACEAQGAVYKSKADITCYSFYRNKIIAAEEGGICTTDDKEAAERMHYLKNMAFDSGHTYYHEEVGYNYRMPNAMAQMALAGLEMYEKNAKKRRLIESWYNNALGTHERRDAVWFYDHWVQPEDIDPIVENIPGARRAFKPLSSFPMYGGTLGRDNARKLSETMVLLPCDPSLMGEDIKRFCSLIP